MEIDDIYNYLCEKSTVTYHEWLSTDNERKAIYLYGIYDGLSVARTQLSEYLINKEAIR